MAELYVGLVHYPIYNKRMDVIASAVTNFDIHDIARTCRTYDVKQYYLIHPKEAQKQMIHKILHYWQEGYGKVYNPDRADALERVHWLEDIEAAAKDIEARTGERPYIVTTDARIYPNTVSYTQTKLAMQMGISYKVLNGILNCRRPLTTSTAMLFEAALGISAGLLMRMQLDCNMQQTANDKPFMERLNQIRKYAAIL